MRRFDVHAHAVVLGADEASQAQVHQLMRLEGFAGSVPGAGWSVRGALDFMDTLGIELQLLSSVSPLTASAPGAGTR